MLFCVLVVGLLQLGHTSYTPTRRQIRHVDSLVRRWAPLVWLAPGERFFPGGVEQFLENVSPTPSKQAFKLKELLKSDVQENEIGAKNDSSSCDQSCRHHLVEEIRSAGEHLTLPLGSKSKEWFLLAKQEMGQLLKNSSSFIHGYNPLLYSVPVYALVTHCPSQKVKPPPHPSSAPKTLQHMHQQSYWASFKKQVDNVSRGGSDKFHRKKQESKRVSDEHKEEIYPHTFTNHDIPTRSDHVGKLPLETAGIPMEDLDDGNKLGPFTVRLKKRDTLKDQTPPPSGPDFMVTYWLFFPFSEGKDVCVVETGPRLLGPWPLPLVGGHCLGKRRRYGSHLGDWEHLSIRFVGGQPHSLYISTHKLGAYYKYINHRNGLFTLYRHEVREGGRVEGWLQRPRFPPVVHLTKPLQPTPGPNIPNGSWMNSEAEMLRPTLFAARGSHGLWAAPGRHQYVRYPRLEDWAGYGIPWTTWTNLQILHQMKGPPSDCILQKSRGQNSKARHPNHQETTKSKEREEVGTSTPREDVVFGEGGVSECGPGRNDWPTWMAYEGHWGEPRDGCHEALSKLGVGGWSCQYSDGPRGIPAKKSRFSCNYP
ncbi:uncharacterized protein LOC124160209 [Ischnura elegans]|uniref:uncharacterized protein LOC124160209 n=1 Tax=Ischnura elegans TaxID=197161 RepID=UPI001ED89E8E|nr:uncharacterized protein LOC124160209 [Ischnura elegans]